MANMVDNHLEVFGDKKDLKEFHKIFTSKADIFNYKYPRGFSKEAIETIKKNTKELKEDKNKQFFSFNNIISVPKEIRKLDYGNYGYYWQINHWGTKWDCGETFFEVQGDYEKLVYFFETAWEPPIKVVETMSSLFPDCLFWLVYSEEDSFSGELLLNKSISIREETEHERYKLVEHNNENKEDDEDEEDNYHYSWCDLFVGRYPADLEENEDKYSIQLTAIKQRERRVEMISQSIKEQKCQTS